jgi:SAM-dependent methyltransferase
VSAAVPHSNRDESILDPVAAYDRLAPHYFYFSNRRSAYLRSVESNIVSRLPAHAVSLLDIGAGDGSRAQRIAVAAGISRLVLLEPSSPMSARAPAAAELWPVRAEELRVEEIPEHFDAITCLWNVLGHIRGSENRIRALKNAAQLLSPRGRIIVDVIHRYNVPSYGLLPTIVRRMRDQISPGETNGDVVASWETATGNIKTYGHVFTDREMRHLAKFAGLECIERVVIDYESGKLHRMRCLGNLLYVFRRTS